MSADSTWPFVGDLNLERRPTPEQKERLEDFLWQLKALSREYEVLVDGYVAVEAPVLRDARSGTVLGLALSYFVGRDSGVVTGYDCVGGSILDGSWLVDTPDGEREQRHVDGRETLWQRRRASVREPGS